MSMFPSIGSTVTNVSTTKTGTAARIDFSDGSSIYVKYDALVISEPKSLQIRSTTPIVHENRVQKSRVEQHFANIPKKTVPVTRTTSERIAARQTRVQEQVSGNNNMLMDNGNVTEEALLQAKLRSESRIDRLAAKWDSEHPSGEASIAAMNG